jgi:hypothetical protein
VARNAIHPLLVNSRGTHFVQMTLAINPPDKVSGLQKMLLKLALNTNQYSSMSIRTSP